MNDEPEGLAWVDYDYSPTPRTPEKCDKCGEDRILRHYCKPAGTPRQQVAEAMRLHVPVDDGEGFFCSCTSTAVLLEQGIAVPYTPEHVAEVAIDALQLTEEPEPPCPLRDCSGHKPRSRLVGPWVEESTEQ